MTESAALTYALRGWPVFPAHGVVDGGCTCRRDCNSPGKHPLVRRGVHDATTDPKQIRNWWTRLPFANVAIATGDVVVIDVDLPTAFESLDALPDLPRTLTSLTGGGGLHLFYASDRTLRNHASKLPGVDRDIPGIDLRGNGGYVVAPPSMHISGNRYAWFDELTPIAPAPTWLREPFRPEPLDPAAVAAPTTESTPYGLAALRYEIDILLRTPVGRRNDQLNRSAFALGQLVAGGHLTEASARSGVEAAARRLGLAEHEIKATTDSGLKAGAAWPRHCQELPTVTPS